MAIVKANYFSESLLRTVNFIAILPLDKPSIDGFPKRTKEQPFKTLYLLHGIFGSEYDWLANTRIVLWAQERNLAVIMPAGENKFYNDMGASGDHFDRYIGEELVEFTRTMFPLSDKRADTFIGGLSMGGMGALYAALRYPDTFSYVGALSTALVADTYPDNDDSPLLHGQRSYYEYVFGKEEQFKDSPNDYYALAKELADSGKKLPNIYMACGTEDDLLLPNRRYQAFLKELGYPVTYVEDRGIHDWNFWDTYILKFLDTLPLEDITYGISSGHIE